LTCPRILRTCHYRSIHTLELRAPWESRRAVRAVLSVSQLPIDQIRVDARFADRLPDPGPEAFEGLVADVQARGILVDLLVTSGGLLLDGHRRLAAARKLGFEQVPVKRLELNGAPEGWEEAAALCVNLCRRQLSEAQRAVLGSSLLRLERAKAKERQLAGQEKGRAHRRHRGLAVETTTPQPAPAKVADRATERVAQTVGVSRKTLERVEVLKRQAPEVLQQVLDGALSVGSAYRSVRTQAAAVQAAQETLRSAGGRIESIESVFGKYRTVYLDPTWVSASGEGEGRLGSLPLRQLGHRDGCHFWLWAPWTAIRRGLVHELVAAWTLRWVAELLWDRGPSGRGRWFHRRTEVLVLCASGNPTLLKTDVDPVHAVEHGKGGKPVEFRRLIETLSLGPRLELWGRVSHEGWEHWSG